MRVVYINHFVILLLEAAQFCCYAVTIVACCYYFLLLFFCYFSLLPDGIDAVVTAARYTHTFLIPNTPPATLRSTRPAAGWCNNNRSQSSFSHTHDFGGSLSVCFAVCIKRSEPSLWREEEIRTGGGGIGRKIFGQIR